MTNAIPNPNRRNFVGGLASALTIGAAAAMTGKLAADEPPIATTEKPAIEPTKFNANGKPYRWGMAIDLDTCTGCGACVVACRTENNVPCSGPEPELRGTEIFWMDILPKKQVEPLEQTIDLLPTPCMHCENPPCVKVCPVNATYLSEEGIVAQIWDRCIGCRYCQVACPYTRRAFNWTEPNFPTSYRNSLNPEVATRPRGVVEKCTFCYHKIRTVRENSLFEGRSIQDNEVEYLPACADACPAKAIVFGDLNDPESHVSRLSRNPRVFHLLDYLGTKPKVFYLGKNRRTES